ncbi:hypothetical protein HYZ64_01405 [Candidatus Berkelbacteria bacterium]|nr:hypothetical protein [Candidatus Berkelbacteria bacterium]
MTERPKPGYHEAELAHEQRIGQTLQTIELQGKSIADNLRQRPYDLKDTLTIASDTNPEANIEASDRRYALPKNHQFMPSPFARQPIRLCLPVSRSSAGSLAQTMG